jgi:hypothetical protein
MVGAACAVLLPYQLALSTPTLTRIKLTAQKNTKNTSPTLSIFSCIHATKMSPPTSNNATNHSSIHLVTIKTSSGSLQNKKKMGKHFMHHPLYYKVH